MKGTKPSAHQPTSPAAGSPSDDSGGGSSKDQDRFLPIANVSRIMKKSLPPNAKISKEAKETVQGCVSEFINFITGEASDKCQREKRKTVNGDDLLWAMKSLGFDSYVAPLKSYLGSYRESGDQEKNGMMRGRLQTGEDGRGGGGGGGGEDGGDGVDGGGGLFRWSAGPVTSGFGGGEGFYGRDDGGGRGSSHGVHW